tara:strand:+ start:3175 stop:3345 length:171 start_codon:yes stop_codon:yes gene_type:complete
MRVLIEVLTEDQFSGRSEFMETVEGTPQFCAGFELAVKTVYPERVVISTKVLEIDN